MRYVARHSAFTTGRSAAKADDASKTVKEAKSKKPEIITEPKPQSSG
jgi:hypothetical protein